MIEYFVLFYWALGLLHTHAEGDFLLNDEGSPNTFLGPPTPSDDLNGLWSTQDLSADNSPFTELSGEDSTACSGGASGFFGGKRIRSNACPGDQNGDIDPELEEIIKRLGGDGWDDGVSAADDDGGTQRAKMCPDVLHIEHVLPVCSSGSPSDMSFTPTGEIKLNWCTLGMFSRLNIMSLRNYDNNIHNFGQ